MDTRCDVRLVIGSGSTLKCVFVALKRAEGRENPHVDVENM